FKVAPLPQHRQTLLASFMNPTSALEAIALLRQPPFQPISMVILNDIAEQSIPILHPFLCDQPPHLVMAVRFAGTASAVLRQIRVAVIQCVDVGARAIELNEADDTPLWAAIADSICPKGDLLLRLGVPLDQTQEMMQLLEATTCRHDWIAPQIMLTGVGLAYTRWPVVGVPADLLAMALDDLRVGLAAIGGYVVVEDLPVVPGIDCAGLDLWGPPPETLALMRSLRSAWDPAGILNPGRYLV
ncbi:MAG: hypothetical protein HGA19_16940, partial [Oscillochloris sp.]|nr:hypothetical protein [Oscillochloris sp.]